MNRFWKRAPVGVLPLCALGLGLYASPARADIILSISDPTLSGVFAANNSQASIAHATDNPARAVVNGAHASLRQFGSQFIFSANVDGYAGDNFIASTGAGVTPASSNFGAIGVDILGTAGEAVGTPVTITLTSGYVGPGNIVITQIANGANYPLNTTSVLNGLKVGDNFDFWAGIDGNDAFNATMTTTLTIVSSPGALTPEPGIAGLLCGLGVTGIGLLRRKYRR